MLDAFKALAERSIGERLLLFVNHVVAAEPAAVERLRAHASRTVRIEISPWPALLPRIGPLALRVTPAGLFEAVGSGEATASLADLQVSVDAGNPALAATRLLAGERPTVRVAGDAAFATDLDWLIDNLRWDAEDDLARFVGVRPAHEIARVGGWIASVVREAARSLRDLAAPADRSASGR